MDAGLGQGQADRLVVDRRDGHHAVVDAGGDELLDAVQQRDTAGDAVLVTAGVGDGHEVNALEPAQDPSVVTAHHAQPDQAGAQVRHGHAPALARMLTAVTMRSRSACDNDGCTGSDRHSLAARSVSGRSTSTWNGARRWLGIG